MSEHRVLIVKLGSYRCAIPLTHVVEIMRPLPIQSFAHMPAFVAGVSIIRGEPTAVVDMASLLGTAATTIGRFVVIRVGERRAALAVEMVVGIQDFVKTPLTSVPPLLQELQPDLVAALGAADEQLLIFLRTARIIPDELWEVLAGEYERAG